MTEQPDPGDWPSHRTGLRDELVKALGEITVIPPVAHRRAQADAVLRLLYREWPWLQAEAEDAAPAATEATDGQPCTCGGRFPIHHLHADRHEAADPDDPELTAEEARALVQELGTDLYRAQDALAFVEECCVIADREGSPVTTAQVREWLKGAQCGRQLVAEHPDIVRDLTAALRERRPDPEADTEQPARTTGNNPPTAPAP